MAYKKIQYKFIWMFLLTSVFPLIIIGLVAVSLLGKMAHNQAVKDMGDDLANSQVVYRNTGEHLKYVIHDQNRRVSTLLYEDQVDLLKNEYAKIVKNENLDFFVVTDAKGKVLVSMSNFDLEGFNIARTLRMRGALKGEVFVSTEILDTVDLDRLGLTKKAKITGIENTQGLVLEAAFPVINQNEIIIGAMCGGYLLNNNNQLIINDIARHTGLVASIFLKDIRVSSNVPSSDGKYAIGSVLDPAVFKVILDGNNYSGPIKVAKDIYMASYAPIFNNENELIGILGIGMPEKRVFALRDGLIKIFIIAVICSAILSLLLGFFIGGRMIRSVRKLRKGIEAFARDDFSHRISIKSNDEIEELAEFFNKMMVQIHEARNKLHEQEKMATMGRMAAIVSHELRNAFAEIHTSAYYLKEKVAKNFPQLESSFRNMESGINSADNILNSLLVFSRPKKLILGDVSVNSIIDDVLGSINLEEICEGNKLEISKEFDPNIAIIKADGMQLKQVIINLVLNATQAMSGGGKLVVQSKNEYKSIKLQISDTGPGISKEIMENLFKPFFTTKSRGLGLGLAVCKEIIEAHKGKIKVDTEPNKGTTFTITLPV